MNLDRSGVVQITDTPIAPCFHSGNGILVGNFPVGTGSATIRHSFIGGYQGAGIVILNDGSTARILRNVVRGPGFSAGVSTDGIELVVGASGNVSHNVVSGNVCVPGDPDCGRNFFEQFQHAGIVGGVAGKRTVISHNVVRHNQVGIYAGEAASIWRNVAVDNGYFGMALQDGFFRLTHDRVSGGHGGVAVIAASADAVAVLRHITITRTIGAGGHLLTQRLAANDARGQRRSRRRSPRSSAATPRRGARRSGDRPAGGWSGRGRPPRPAPCESGCYRGARRR